MFNTTLKYFNIFNNKPPARDFLTCYSYWYYSSMVEVSLICLCVEFKKHVSPTSLERPIIWSPDRPSTAFCRRPVDALIQNFCIFVLPVKSRNRYIIQGLLLLKNNFLIKSSVFVLIPESPLKVPCRSRTLEPLVDLQGTTPGRHVPAEQKPLIQNIITPELQTTICHVKKRFFTPNIFISKTG